MSLKIFCNTTATDHYNSIRRKTGNSQTALPERDARMPACGREGGGDVVVKCQPVTGWTGRRFARERNLKREEMDEPEKANDGRSSGALFSGRAGDSMQQVKLCSGWCALGVKILIHRLTLRYK